MTARFLHLGQCPKARRLCLQKGKNLAELFFRFLILTRPAACLALVFSFGYSCTSRLHISRFQEALTFFYYRPSEHTFGARGRPFAFEGRGAAQSFSKQNLFRAWQRTSPPAMRCG